MKKGEYHYGVAARLNDAPDKKQKEFIQFVGREISKITIDDENRWVMFEFTNGTACAFKTAEPDCCAKHYMSTDCNLAEFIGAKMIKAIVKTSPAIEDDTYGVHEKMTSPAIEDDTYGVHEKMFYEVITTKGSIDFTSHNEHNGYYGGVGVEFVVIRALQAAGRFHQ